MRESARVGRSVRTVLAPGLIPCTLLLFGLGASWYAPSGSDRTCRTAAPSKRAGGAELVTSTSCVRVIERGLDSIERDLGRK